ncbi:hypothetical protein IKS57_01835 [bacterium]|nr:hypothetical protein [bacterium]
MKKAYKSLFLFINMSKTNIKQSTFLTYEELIKKLENRGLKIIEKDKLI